MKKLSILLLATVTTFLMSDISAQNMAVGGEAGFSHFTGGTGISWVNIGGTFQYDINETHSVKAGVDFGIALSDFGSNLLLIVPEYRYAINETYDGFYVGGYFKLGFLIDSDISGGSNIGFGANGGYEMPISDTFILDFNAKFGYSSYTIKVTGPFGVTASGSTGGLDIGLGVGAKVII